MVTTIIERAPILRTYKQPFDYNGHLITSADAVYAIKDGHKGLFIEITLQSGEKVSQIWDWGTKPDEMDIYDIACNIALGRSFLPWFTILDRHEFREGL